MARFSFTLLILLPFVLRSGLLLSRLATRDERLSRFLSAGAALAGWLLAIHVFGLISHSFYVGLFVGTALAATPGALIWKKPVPQVEPMHRTSPWLWVGAVAMMGLLAWPQLRFEEHDECEAMGHVGLAQEIARGTYPPRYPYFPTYEVKYHYGIDLANAAVSAVLGHADISKALHGISIALWGYSFCLLWLLGEALLGGTLGGAATGCLGLLAGGFQLFCRGPHPLSLLFMGDCTPIGTWITPPFLSNFLQHPWTLATPVGAATVLIFTRRRTSDPFWFGALALLLVCLSISQVVFFGSLLASICFAGSFENRRLSFGLAARFAALAVAGGLAASQLHGFFAPSSGLRVDHLQIHPMWVAFPFKKALAWNAQSFGLLLPLGLVGVLVLRRERLLFLCMGVGGAVLSNVFSDENAILKFSTLAQLPLGILCSAAIVWVCRKPRGWPLGAAAALGCTCFSLLWAGAVGSDMPGLWFCHALVPPPPAPDLAAIDFLRANAKPDELTYRTTNAKTYALYGGLPEPILDYSAGVHFPKGLIERRTELLAHPAASPEPYLEQSFRWFVVGPEDGVVARNLEGWAAAGRADLRAEFPPLRVYYLHGGE